LQFENDIINTLDGEPFSSPNALLAIVSLSSVFTEITSDVIKAYDVLNGRGHKFIFTNYVRWAFGAFSEGKFLSPSSHNRYCLSFLLHFQITNVLVSPTFMKPISLT